MLKRPFLTIAITVIAFVLASGCTVHPPGEQEQRHASLEAGKSLQNVSHPQDISPLPDNPTLNDMVKHALSTNAEVEQKYWEWRSAIEQIPQDGTQSTNLALSASINISRGSTGLGQMVAGAGNDPMADIVLPPKLSAAANRALENARAAGARYRKAQFDLRLKVLNAYYDYALTAELIRLEKTNVELLQTTAMVTEARNGAGTSNQQELLKARNELTLSENEVQNMMAELPGQRAALNALLNRPAEAPLPVSQTLPKRRKINFSYDQLLALAEKQNPEIEALATEVAGKKDGVSLAKFQYLPDISLGASTDLKGIAQSLLGMVTVPWIRHEAIDAAIAQAEANLRATEAMQQQARNNISVQVIQDIYTLRDADRQLELFDKTILPRAKQMVELSRTAYESGNKSLLEFLDDERSLISIRRLIAQLQMTSEKRLADLEDNCAQVLVGEQD